MQDSQVIWLLAILGWLIFALFQLQDGIDKTKKKEIRFSYRYWINDHWIHLTISLLGMIALVFMLPSIQDRIGMMTGLEGFSDMMGAAYVLAFVFGLGSSFFVQYFYKRVKKARQR